MTAPAPRELTLIEDDYCYGRGQIKIRVERIDREHPVRYHGDTFYRVEGVQLSSSGAELGCREVLVRARRLRTPPTRPATHGSASVGAAPRRPPTQR